MLGIEPGSYTIASSALNGSATFPESPSSLVLCIQVSICYFYLLVSHILYMYQLEKNLRSSAQSTLIFSILVFSAT